jgi:hypothetical protein
MVGEGRGEDGRGGERMVEGEDKRNYIKTKE